MTHNPFSPDDYEAIRFPEITDALPPGVFTEVNLYARVAYSGNEDNPRVHINVVRRPAETNWLVFQPLVVALMNTIAKQAGEGLEKGLEALVQEAIRRAGHQLKATDVEDEEKGKP